MWVDNLSNCRRKVYSQLGEEGVLEAIFSEIDTPTKFLVDLGAGDGKLFSNTQLFLDNGWSGRRFDIHPSNDIITANITPDTVCPILDMHGVPNEFDLLSIDLDSFDWYVLRSVLRNYRPRVFVAEINNQFPAEPPMTTQYDPAFRWTKKELHTDTEYFGATLSAYDLLAKSFGYSMVYAYEFNAYFVLTEFVPSDAIVKNEFVQWGGWSKDPLNRPWITVTIDDCK